MTRIKNCDKSLKGTPVEDLAKTDGVEGHLVRTQVLKRSGASERAHVRQAVAAITDAQCSDGSWSGSVIETCSQVDRLLAYGLSVGSPRVRKARKWLFTQQLADHPVWTGMFAESRKVTNSIKEARGGRGLRALYAKHYRHLTAEPCCASTPVVATCCALEVLFALGEDVSSSHRWNLRRLFEQVHSGYRPHQRLAQAVGPFGQQGLPASMRGESGHHDMRTLPGSGRRAL